MSINEFRKRMEHQKELELVAHRTYGQEAMELKDKRMRELFLEIGEQEIGHAKMVESILSKL